VTIGRGGESPTLLLGDTLAAYANALVCVFRVFVVFFFYYQLLRISFKLYILVRLIDFII
jgi:hypothetical protein